MIIPQLKAQAIITNEEKTKVLVQCDIKETFYRFPGGSIEFGETASYAIRRELIEEFDLRVEVNSLAIVNENIVEIEGKKHHQCTLLHWCTLLDNFKGSRYHKEHSDIILTWRTVEELKLKPTYPEGTADIIASQRNGIRHLVIQKKYD